MLPEVVCADIHEFDRVQSGAAVVRIRRRMGGLAVKSKNALDHSKRINRHGSVKGFGMPRQTQVDIPECAGFDHEGFRRAIFLARTSVISDRASRVAGLDARLDVQGRCERGDTEPVVPAAVLVSYLLLW